ncbi:SDR family NAD(P)-dependent oxidoreductase [Salipiger abyssi]|uniref:SDR family NAD(P)-dependent oxidoreductase n=1 Tax=Salipiger abyssi TaxID=1250539 RepID=UPI00405A208A
MTPPRPLLAGRRILITGGAGGIGRACARALLQEGAALTLADLDARALTAAARDLTSNGATFTTHVTDLEGIAACRAAIEAAGGPLYGLIHLAGLYEHDPFDPGEEGVWSRAIQSNLTNAYDLARAFEGHHAGTLADGPARLVLTSSLAFRRGVPDRVAYAAAKGGIVGLVRSLSRRMAPHVLVNAVAPGLIATPMTAEVMAKRGDRLVQDIPLRRPGTAAEVAGVIRFLCGPDATYMTGQALNIDGGVTAS